MARTVLVAVSVWCLVVTGPALAQRRGERPRTGGELDIRLPSPIKIGTVFLPARVYRLSLGAGKLSFSDPLTMTTQATVPVSEKQMDTTVKTPTAEVVQKGNKVLVRVRHRDRLIEVQGVQTSAIEDGGSRVTLAGKEETQLGKKVVQNESELALVQQALVRYVKSVLPCADRAHRGHWGTDDPRFEKCVCPWMDKWRLPPVSKEMRVHSPLAKGKSGFSFSVTPNGRANSCRVWIGAKPPKDEPASGTATASHKTGNERASAEKSKRQPK